MKKIAVIGHFAFGKNLLNGQTVKTKILTDELVRQLGEEEILRIDTHGGRLGSLVKAPFQALKALRKAEHVLILPAHNGLRIFAPLLSFLRRFFRGRKLHYLVIGGWLPEFVKGRKGLAKALKRFDSIEVETGAMKKALEAQGFPNAVIFPNCKALHVLAPDELVFPEKEPYKLCTFSRVMREKGIEDAVSAVARVNEAAGKTVYILDLYGQIDESQLSWFREYETGFPDSVKYRGAVAYDNSVSVLKDYFALLFPTFYEGEGFAGTLIDALASGLPMIASDWRYNSEVVSEDVGFIFPARNVDALVHILTECCRNPEEIKKKKINCIRKYSEFSVSNVIRDFLNRIEVKS